jgi:hypothetical protein
VDCGSIGTGTGTVGNTGQDMVPVQYLWMTMSHMCSSTGTVRQHWPRYGTLPVDDNVPHVQFHWYSPGTPFHAHHTGTVWLLWLSSLQTYAPEHGTISM